MSNLTDRELDVSKGKLAPKFITMTRTDWAAYEYLSREAEAKEWVSTVLGEPYEDDFYSSFYDGVALCKLANKIWPNSITRYNPPQSYRFQMVDNISLFVKCLQDHGLDETVLFNPIDLIEKKNLPLVVTCLQNLATLVEKQGHTTWVWKKTKRDFTPKEIQEAKKLDNVTVFSANPKQQKSSEPEQEKSITPEEKQKRLQSTLKKREGERIAREQLLKRQQEQDEEKKRLEEERIKREEDEAERKRKAAEEERLRSEEQRRQEEQRKENELAAKYGGHDSLSNIKKLVAQLESSVKPGTTILHLAAEKANSLLVKYIIEQVGILVNEMNENDETALHLAAKSGDAATVDVLLNAGASVNPMNRDGDLPIHMGVRSKSDKVVERLLTARAEVNARNYYYDSPLLIAAADNNKGALQALVKRGADVNVSNKDELSSLHLVAQNGNVELIDVLYSSGNLDLNPRSKNNATPLQLAIENRQFAAVEKLVQLGADLTTKQDEGWSPLYTAAYNGAFDTAKLLLLKGSNVNGTTEEGWTPLHAACSQGHLNLVKLFIEDYKAQINVLNEEGTTPLVQAVSTNRLDIVQYLTEKGADVNLAGKEGWTPIHTAIFNEYSDIIKYLVSKKVNLDAVCAKVNGYTPLQILISTDTVPTSLVDLLIKSGINLNVKNASGGTALHVASFWGHIEVVKKLVEAGANMEILNDKGRTPLEVAARYGREQTALYLAQKSNKPVPKIKDRQGKTTSMQAPGSAPTPDKLKP